MLGSIRGPRDYEYPDWGIGIGWALASMSLVCIPIGAVVGVWETKGTPFLEVRYVLCFRYCTVECIFVYVDTNIN